MPKKRKAKKHHLFGTLLSALLILAMACPAAGYFEKNHLIQVVYNENDNELASDLGDLSAIDFSQQDVELRPAGTVSLDRFPSISSWSDLNVGYFAYDNGTYENWFATTQPSAPTVNVAGGFSIFQNGALQVQNHYGFNEVAPGVAVASAGDTYSYDQILNDGSASPGIYAGFNDTAWQQGESPLAALDTLGYVDMYLYHFIVADLDKGLDTNTDWTAVIRLNADGGTVLNPFTSQNQAPIANDDTAITSEDTAVSIDVISNDTDADGTIDGTAVLIVSDASDGTTSNNGDGTVTYTPDTGFTGEDSFTYTVDDNEGATSNAATVTVNVTGSQNQNPQASDDEATTFEDTAVTINVIANDTDPDGAIDPASIAIVTNPTNGTADPQSDGTVEYTPTTGFTGTDTFTYTAKDDGDPQATSNEATATITVKAQGAITAPSVNYPSDQGEVKAVRPTLSVNNSTAGGGVVLTYDFEVYSDSEMSNLEASDTGVAEGDETTAWVVDEDLGENTSYYWRARARASDGTEFSPWMNLAAFFVSAVNEAPSAPNISQPADGSEVDTLRPVLAVTNASDPDLDPLTYKFEIYEEDMTTLKVEQAGVEESDGTTSWQVGEGEELDDNTAYWWRARAKDDEDEEGDWTDLVTFFVNITNDAPSAPLVVSPQDGSVVDTRTPVLEVENSIDLDLDTLTYFFEIDQVNTFDSAEKSEGVAQGDGGTTSWEPSELADNTTYYWRAKANDSTADSDWTTASMFVDLANDPPVASDDSAITTEATAVVVDVIVNDTDAEDEIAPATVTIVVGPADGTAEEEGDGTVTYTPDDDFLGEDTFTYTVEDDDGAVSNEATVTVLVNDEPTAPTLDSPATDTVVNTPMPTLSVNNAADSDPLTYLFEIYSDEDLLSESLVASATVEEGDDGITSWIGSVALTKGQTYYWRCLAKDGHDAGSSWMETARFTLGELALVLTIPSQAKEGDGVLEGEGTVVIPEAQSQDLEVSLESRDLTEVEVQTAVTIPAGETSVAFDLTIIDDSDHDGTQSVDLLAFVAGWTSATAEMVVGDNEKSGSKGSSGCFISTVGGTPAQEPASNNGFPFPLLCTILLLMVAFSRWFCQIKRSLNTGQRACFQCETR